MPSALSVLILFLRRGTRRARIAAPLRLKKRSGKQIGWKYYLYSFGGKGVASHLGSILDRRSENEVINPKSKIQNPKSKIQNPLVFKQPFLDPFVTIPIWFASQTIFDIFEHQIASFCIDINHLLSDFNMFAYASLLAVEHC
jgi:hypothetical protein